MPNQTMPFASILPRRIWQGCVRAGHSVNDSVNGSNLPTLQPAYSKNQNLSFLSTKVPYGIEFLVGGSYNATIFCAALSHLPILLPMMTLNQTLPFESRLGVWPIEPFDFPSIFMSKRVI